LIWNGLADLVKEFSHFCRMEPRFAIVGCGRIAQRHAEQIAKVGHLKAVCDIDFDKASALGAQYHAKAYSSLGDLLHNETDIDFVTICTPNGLHAAHAIEAMNAGKHVLCEKPLAINVTDARRMIDASQLHHRKLFVVKQNRYNPPVVHVKKLIQAGKLGRIFSFQMNCFWNRPQTYYTNSWKGSKDLDGGTLFTQFSHFIDLLYWLLGDVESVKSTIKNLAHHYIEIEDTGMVIFEMKSGAIGSMNYSVNSFEKNMEGSITILGEKGTVKIGGQYLNTLEYQCIEGENMHTNFITKSANDYGFYQGSMSNHDIVYTELMEALKNPEHDMANAYDGLKTVEIIEKIYHSGGMF
jgi:UDP-N-acetyl-2-amino-2-deoxyglucuronate dehydrogenase